MARPRPLLPLLLLPLLVAPFAWAAPAHMLPQEGPDAPTPLFPAATVWAFDNETYSYTEGVRATTIAVPSVAWNRVVVTFRGLPGGDPWDRFFGVGIGGAEVLRGTTPRTDFTVTKDVTEFASLLPPGGSAEVNVFYGSYVGAPQVTVKLDFYDDPAAPALAKAPADHVVRPFAWAYFGGHGSSVVRNATFPATAPSSGAVELSLSGHGQAEFWYQYGLPFPRIFTVYVDGVAIGQARALPYVYALLGFEGSPLYNDVVHPVMWWSAHRALDVAGVHTGPGEIPPYRADIPPEHLGLFTGAKEVKLVQSGNTGYWIGSVTFLLNE